MDGSFDVVSAADFGSLERDRGLAGAATGVQYYRALERRWNGFTVRDGRLVKRGGLTRPQLKRVLVRMEEDVQQRVSLSELATLTGLSVSHFCRAFKESTGLAPYKWHLDAKIRKAQRLIIDGDKSLAEIASELGFADQSHFTRTFRRSVGSTPRACLKDRER